jgi:haloacetate dehalogenase
MPDARFVRLDGTGGPALRYPGDMRKRFSNPKAASLPGGHFFVDQFPDDVARILSGFLA